MVVHGAFGEVEPAGDLAVAEAPGEQQRNFAFAPAELGCERSANHRAIAARLCRPGGEQAPRAGQPRELAVAATCELHARADDQVLDRARHENLTGLGRPHHAGGDVEGRASWAAVADLTLAGVKAGLNTQPEVEQLVADFQRAADRSRGAIEYGGDAALARLDLAARVARERLADHAVMTVDQLVPALATEPHRMRARLRHVGAQHGREHRLRGWAGTDPREELLNFTDHQIGVPEVRPVVDGVQLQEPSGRDVLGEIPAGLD